jgi:hypothetical protein
MLKFRLKLVAEMTFLRSISLNEIEIIFLDILEVKVILLTFLTIEGILMSEMIMYKFFELTILNFSIIIEVEHDHDILL